MTEAQDILRMIEEVSPDDTEKLDEIDARVWCFISDDSDISKAFIYTYEYTRSLDALQDIMPEGWVIWYQCYRHPEYQVTLNTKQGSEPLQAVGRYLPTEALARLHAIIQAHERGRDG